MYYAAIIKWAIKAFGPKLLDIAARWLLKLIRCRIKRALYADKLPKVPPRPERERFRPGQK